MVRDLQSQQATAAATLQKDRVSTDAARERAATAKDLADRLKRGEEAEELSAAARAGSTDAPSYASETYWEDRYVAELEDAGGDTVAAATFAGYVGYDRLAPLLRGVCPSATTPAGCAAVGSPVQKPQVMHLQNLQWFFCIVDLQKDMQALYVKSPFFPEEQGCFPC